METRTEASCHGYYVPRTNEALFLHSGVLLINTPHSTIRRKLDMVRWGFFRSEYVYLKFRNGGGVEQSSAHLSFVCSILKMGKEDQELVRELERRK